MCLFTEHGKKETAGKDILCWKVVGNDVSDPTRWKPIYQNGYTYRFNVVERAESDGRKIGGLDIVERDCGDFGYSCVTYGFHSWTKRFQRYAHPCVIPKGTEFCLGDRNDIVSLETIVFRRFSDFLKFRFLRMFGAGLDRWRGV